MKATQHELLRRKSEKPIFGCLLTITTESLNIAGPGLTQEWEILQKSYILVYLVIHINVFPINISSYRGSVPFPFQTYIRRGADIFAILVVHDTFSHCFAASAFTNMHFLLRKKYLKLMCFKCLFEMWQLWRNNRKIR